MLNNEILSENLCIDDPVVFLKITPDLNDHLLPKNLVLTLYSKNSHIDVTLDGLNRNNLTIVRILERILKNKTLITWDIKKLISYFLFHFNYQIKLKNVIDLKYAECFLGAKQNIPNTFQEAIQRTLPALKSESFCKLNQSLYLPLSLDVLPYIETRPILVKDVNRDTRHYINYDLVGHKNSRLICSQPSEKFLNVHTLTEEMRSKIVCPDGFVFLEFDYNHMEVNVLQWLSNDEKLLEIIKSGKDLYEEIYFIVFNKKCQTIDDRNLIKRIFLPYFFGLQSKTLANEMSVQQDVAQKLLNQIKINFSTACSWIENQVNNKSTAVDYFGKIRTFTDDALYKSRNFYIQSPAAIICLLKFIDLFAEMKEYILCNIHDAYILYCPINEIKKVIKKTKNILESNPHHFPLNSNIYLKVSCSVGNNLANLKKYPI